MGRGQRSFVLLACVEADPVALSREELAEYEKDGFEGYGSEG